MAVSEQTPYIEYTANGTATSFALEFDCEKKDHLIVLVDDVEPVVGAWSLSNGAVVFNTAPESGKKITLQRNTPFSRTANYQSYNNSFRPPAVNKDFDWIWLKLQELGVADWILSNRINALKNYVDDRDDELRAYLMEEIRKQGVALDQLDDYYNYLMQRLAQIAVDKGWDASFVVDASGKTQQEINNFYLTPYQFGAVGDGVYHALSEYYSTLAQAQTIYPFATSLTNSIDWAALQKQANHAIAYGYGTLNIPDGNFVINKTLNLGNLSVVGNGFGSRITPVIDDGSVAVNVVPGSNFFKLKDFRIWSDGARPNCIGLSVGKSDSDLNASNRYSINGVIVHGVKQGVDMCGWIGDVDLFIDYCDIGFIGKSLNAGRYLIHTEQCTEAGRIDGAQGSTLQLMVEGDVTTIQKGFLLDAIVGGSLLAPYFEAVGTSGSILEYFCKIGTLKNCVGVTIDSGATFGHGVSDSYWVFDNIDGLSVDEHWIQGSQTYSKGRLYRTTANTKRIRRLNFTTPQNLSFWIKDNSKSLKPYQNLFANGNFLAGIKGFRRIDALVSATVTKVTDITRSSASSAVKVQMGAGVLGGNGGFTFPNVIYKNFKGKKVFLGVWLYVPDIAEYNDFSLKSPNVALNDGVTSSLSGLTLFSKDQWHFVIVQHTLNANATELTMKVAPVGYRGATVTAADITGNEYVVVGGVYLLDNSSEVDANRVANGLVENSGYSGRIVGENIELYSDDLTGLNSAAGWSVGDKVVFQNSDFIQEYVCINTIPQFRPTRWVNKAFPTASLPALTASDVGVSALDTTTNTFKRWTGSAWI